MSKLITINSFQRSAGKSTVATNVAVLIAKNGYRVGLVDTDFQSPAIHYFFGLPESYTDYCLNDYLSGKCDIQRATYDVTPHLQEDIKGRIFITPASIEVPQIMNAVQKGFDLSFFNAGLDILNSKLSLDFVIIDTHAGLTEQTLGLIAMSDSLVIVTKPDPQTYQGIAVTLGVARKLELAQIALIVNQLPLIYDAPQAKSQFEATFNCPVIAIIPNSNEIVNLTGGAIFVAQYPNHPITAQFEQVTQALQTDSYS